MSAPDWEPTTRVVRCMSTTDAVTNAVSAGMSVKERITRCDWGTPLTPPTPNQQAHAHAHAHAHANTQWRVYVRLGVGKTTRTPQRTTTVTIRGTNSQLPRPTRSGWASEYLRGRWGIAGLSVVTVS
ncbi:hypothetical protein LY76DRAFT_592110 [Colletotrichum caudatum]|nr:hypothetical protein LY76DRAFT_592110 [Colletotrichum caudatum]